MRSTQFSRVGDSASKYSRSAGDSLAWHNGQRFTKPGIKTMMDVTVIVLSSTKVACGIILQHFKPQHFKPQWSLPWCTHPMLMV